VWTKSHCFNLLLNRESTALIARLCKPLPGKQVLHWEVVDTAPELKSYFASMMLLTKPELIAALFQTIDRNFEHGVPRRMRVPRYGSAL